MKRVITGLLVLVMAWGCTTVDTERIPSSAVDISFTTQAQWELYGVNGALENKRFIKTERLPVNYPYTSMTQTGYGGVLLVGDIHGNAVAYDLACPVERSASTRIMIDNEAHNAYCPKCGSVYDIYSNYGYPLAGKAAQEGYGLQRYVVTRGMNGEYMRISR